MKRIILILLSAAMILSVMPSYAAGWVTVSSWAYNSVSNFKKEGLLPDSFSGISDYTQNITRLQFAELAYSVMTKTKNFGRSGYANVIMEDTGSEAAKTLNLYGIMKGEDYKKQREEVLNNGNRVPVEDTVYKFYPDRLLTREEMAAIADRIVHRFCPYILIQSENESAKWVHRPKDFGDVSDWAKESVEETIKAGIISGMDDGTFAPKSNLSIEQTICVLYRLYNALPTAPAADGADITSSEEQSVKTYANGIEETKKGNVLYLKDNGRVLTEFETDIYSNIYCATAKGKIYAAAQNLYGTTDVYDLDEKKLIFKIPYPTYSAEEDYIVVKSENIGPFTFGLYSYDGKEILAPKYSMSEIDEIKANGMKIPVDKKQEASGRIYYSNREDGGKLYRIDSNGENRQKLSDHSCGGVEYANGYLFYHTYDDDHTKSWWESPLYCIKADGTDEIKLTENGAKICDGHWYRFNPNEGSSGGFDMDVGNYDPYSQNAYNPTPRLLCHDDEWIYYIEENENGYSSLWRVSFSEDEMRKEEVSKGIGAVGQVQYKDGIVYFISLNVSGEDHNNAVYRFDGETLEKLSGDINVIQFGFNEDKLLIVENGTSDVYMADGESIEIYPEIAETRKKFQENYDGQRNSETSVRYKRTIHEFTGMSDDKYFIYNINEWTEIGNYGDDNYSVESKDTIMARDADGNAKVVRTGSGFPQTRIGDVLYFEEYAYTSQKQENHIVAYDLNTGESYVAADNVHYIYYFKNAGGKDWFNFTDYNFNVRRYNVKTNTVDEVFPNNNLHRYGKVQRMLGTDSGMYKVDTDGNYSFITDETAADCMYVENGASDAMHF